MAHESFKQSPNAHTRRAVLWFTMRSRSTAFTRAISQLDGVKILFEPFYSAYAYGPERYLTSFTDIVPEEIGLTYKHAQSIFEAPYDDYKLIFAKDCTSGLPVSKLQYVPKGFYHTFLIRNPVDICISMFCFLERLPKKKEIFSQYEVDDLVGCQNMLNLYQHLSSLSEPVFVLDSDALLANPKHAMTLYFDFIGFQFDNAVLDWKKDTSFSEDWWFSKSDLIGNEWSGAYDNAMHSSKFKPSSNNSITYEELPDRYKFAIDRMMKPYEIIKSYC